MHTGGKRYLAGPASGVTPQSRPAPTRNPADATLPPQIRFAVWSHVHTETASARILSTAYI